ncbi:lipid-A-disaccharide synthase [Synechococcus elongatus]|uniref:Lipid-A-disaccharide synthase n=2 Tax=Synechococcus elongatus TaxID=32046 RepID=A0AAQ3RCS8_SYNEL
MAALRLFISTGEVSGDLQGSLLIAALFRQAQQLGIELEVFALGGDRMAAAGATLLANTIGISSIGIWEALPYVWPTWRLQQKIARQIRETPLDAAILIDYIGPNIGWGGRLPKSHPNIPIFYYIAPQEWVWSFGEGKTTQLVGFSNRIFAIFPGEAKYYRERGAAVSFVGHPLIDELQNRPDRAMARAQLGLQDQERAIALYPASRPQELKFLLPTVLAAAQQLNNELPNLRFFVPLSQEQFRATIEQAAQDLSLPLQVVGGETTRLVQAAADLAIAKSGTVNLEIGLQGVPQVVIYRVGAVTAWIARHILRFSIPFMSPVNLVNMEAIVPELLQDEANPDRIAAEAKTILLDPERQAAIQAGYGRMRQSLGEPGVCDRAAKEILISVLKQQSSIDTTD